MNKRTRRILFGAIKLALAAALLIAVLSQVRWSDQVVRGDDGAEIVQHGLCYNLTHVDRVLLGAALVAFGVSHVIAAVRWRLLLGVQDIHLSVWQAIRSYRHHCSVCAVARKPLAVSRSV